MVKLLQILALVLTLEIMAGCAIPDKLTGPSCEGVDPYELGRRHGSQGLPNPVSIDSNADIFACVPQSPGSDQKKYTVGRNAGLVDYCTKENGFLVAKEGFDYLRVCPSLQEEIFLEGYASGIEFRKLEQKSEKLKERSSLLQNLLKFQKSTRHSNEIQTIEKQISSNDKKLEELNRLYK